jgi:hypothetical protein
MTELIRYDEKFNTKRIFKARKWNLTEDTESVNYVPDKELPEHIIKVAFMLDSVQCWEEFDDPFNKFQSAAIKCSVTVYGEGSFIILESFEYFDAVMEAFIEKQQANGKSNTEGTQAI